MFDDGRPITVGDAVKTIANEALPEGAHRMKFFVGRREICEWIIF
jgi:hypothetical protein